MRVLLSVAVLLFLGGCQTNYQYVRIGVGPELPYAQARCEIMSASVERGVVAWGSADYVLGAQIGNMIGNEIRKAQFMKNCMVLQGWRQVPVGTSTSAPPTYNHAPPLTPSGEEIKFPPPPRMPGT